MKPSEAKVNRVIDNNTSILDFLRQYTAAEVEPDPLIWIRSYVKNRLPDSHIGLIRFHDTAEDFTCTGDIPEPINGTRIIAALPPGWLKDEQSYYRAADSWLIPIRESGMKPPVFLVVSPITSSDETHMEEIAAQIRGICTMVYLIWNNAAYTARENTATIVSQMAHDMQSLINMVQSGDVPEALIKEKIRYIDRVSREITFFMREIHLSKVPVGINDLLSGIMTDLEIPPQIRLNFIPGENINIRLDVELMDKAISAIIENAVMATQPEAGSIDLRVSKKELFVPGSGREAVEIVIEDRGIGIPHDFEKMVKNPFFTTWKEQGKPGLGLTNADKIIAAHGGTLSVKNRPSGGVTVAICLPGEN